jgi:hypothetical protein
MAGRVNYSKRLSEIAVTISILTKINFNCGELQEKCEIVLVGISLGQQGT